MPLVKSRVGCKWIYEIKTQFDSSIKHYKARFMVKDFTQKYGIDYEDIFVPAAHLSFVCPLVVFVASLVFFLSNGCKKNAFLIVR